MRARLPTFVKRKDNLFFIFPMLTPAFCKKFEVRTVKGRTRLLSSKGDCVVIETWNQHGHFMRKIPKKIRLGPELFNLLGRWYGDRAGEEDSFGVSTTCPAVIKQFIKIITTCLKQPRHCICAQITMGEKVRNDRVTETIQSIKKTGIENDRIFVSNFKKSGGFAYSINVSIVAKNAPLSMFVLQPLSNPKILEVIFKKQPYLFYAFLAGLFDADGVIDPKQARLGWLFAGSKTRGDFQKKIASKMEQAKWLLKLMREVGKFKTARIYQSILHRDNAIKEILFTLRITKDDFTLFKNNLLQRRYLPEKFTRTKTLVINGDRTQPEDVLFVFYIKLTGSTTSLELAKAFNKSRGNACRLLLALRKQKILKIIGRKWGTTKYFYMYDCGPKAEQFVRCHWSTMVDILTRILERPSISYKKKFDVSMPGVKTVLDNLRAQGLKDLHHKSV